MTPFLADLASTLIVIASEWVKVPADQLAALKKLRSKLGSVKHGLTEKNRALLRRFDDTRLLENLARLPDRLWRTARRNLSVSKRWFIDLQNALAIDILLHVPLRIENLGALKFDEHLHWPQGHGKSALIVIREDDSGLRVTCSYTAICGQPSSTTIARKVSRLVERMPRSLRQCANADVGAADCGSGGRWFESTQLYQAIQ